MIRKNIYITQEQIEFLDKLNEKKFSEHVRVAIDEYIEKRKKNNARLSPSKITEVRSLPSATI